MPVRTAVGRLCWESLIDGVVRRVCAGTSMPSHVLEQTEKATRSYHRRFYIVHDDTIVTPAGAAFAAFARPGLENKEVRSKLSR